LEKRRNRGKRRNNKEGKMFESLCDNVLGIVERWIPKKKYSKETEYRDELMEFTRNELKRSQQDILFSTPKKHRVKKEAGRSHADIEIDRNIGIELKRNLKGKTEMNRLSGQIIDYEGDYSCIIVVLCGEVSEETVEELEYQFKQRYGGVGFGLGTQGPRVTVVRKDEASIERRKKKTSSKKPQSPFDIPSFNPPTFDLPSFDSPFDTAPKKKGRKKKK
jgi:hypothetical protein